MTPMENLNKDPGPARDGCGHGLFIWRRTPPLHHPPTTPSQVAHVMWSAGSSYSVPSPRGVCCSILMTKRGAGARSHYHTLICLKKKESRLHNTVGRSPQEIQWKPGGCVNDKREKQPHFFCPRDKGCPISECRWAFHQNRGDLHAFQ